MWWPSTGNGVNEKEREAPSCRLKARSSMYSRLCLSTEVLRREYFKTLTIQRWYREGEKERKKDREMVQNLHMATFLFFS